MTKAWVKELELQGYALELRASVLPMMSPGDLPTHGPYLK